MRVLAYIDLPSGSAIFQILIAGLLGISVAFRSFWNRVWQLVTGRRRKQDTPTDSSASSAEAPGPAASPEGSPSAADTSVPRSSEDASARKG
jgi:hypothetical protein